MGKYIMITKVEAPVAQKKLKHMQPRSAKIHEAQNRLANTQVSYRALTKWFRPCHCKRTTVNDYPMGKPILSKSNNIFKVAGVPRTG